LAATAQSKVKQGFFSNGTGIPIASNEAAKMWLAMGMSDTLKRANRRSYPAIIHEIAELPDSLSPPSIHLADREIAAARESMCARGWQPPTVADRVVGINVGAGQRWPQKSLPLGTLEEVIAHLLQAGRARSILLLGGPSEGDRMDYLAGRLGRQVIHTGAGNPLRQFAALLTFVDVLLTADTLAMHIALALRKRLVVHFGPTSPWEIDLYGLGEKIIGAPDSAGCYCAECPRKPACNERIEAGAVASALLRALQQDQPG
jgi:heptosyltransferase-2